MLLLGTGMLSQWAKEPKITSLTYTDEQKLSNRAKQEGGLGTPSWYLNEIPKSGKRICEDTRSADDNFCGDNSHSLTFDDTSCVDLASHEGQ